MPGVRQHIDADEQGHIACITWTTDEQLSLLHRYPDLIMMDGTYKVIFMACYGCYKVYFPDYLYSIAWALIVSGGTFKVAMVVTIKIKEIAHFCKWLIPTGSVQSSATAVASTVTFDIRQPCHTCCHWHQCWPK